MMCMGMETRPSKEDRTIIIGPWDENGFGGGIDKQKLIFFLKITRREKRNNVDQKKHSASTIITL